MGNLCSCDNIEMTNDIIMPKRKRNTEIMIYNERVELFIIDDDD